MSDFGEGGFPVKPPHAVIYTLNWTVEGDLFLFNLDFALEDVLATGKSVSCHCSGKYCKHSMSRQRTFFSQYLLGEGILEDKREQVSITQC